MIDFDTHPDIKSILYDQDAIEHRIIELGSQITSDYTDKVEAGEDLLLVTMLRGAAFFSSDLARAIRLPVMLDYMKVSSYGNSSQSSGIVTVESDIATDVSGKHVLIVEDVIDSGVTLRYIRKNMLARKPLSVEIAAFLEKKDAAKESVQCRYIGLECPDEFLVGYGLDYAGRYRNLPCVCILKPEVYA